MHDQYVLRLIDKGIGERWDITLQVKQIIMN